jgi:Uma2 family endonuclease
MYKQTNPPLSPKEILPTMYDLPSEAVEDSGLPDQYHLWQADLLEKTFDPPDYPQDRVFTATDLNLYYDLRHPHWYKRPDWFAVLGVDRLYEKRESRLSYVIWQEGVDPFIVVELLSPSTEKEDLGRTLRTIAQPPTKWEVYEKILRIPYYVVFNGYTNQLRLFQITGNSYQEIPLSYTKFWLAEIKLGLGLWSGEYQGLNRLWLRWYDQNDHWLPTPVEKEQQLIEQERQRAKQERQRANQLERENAQLKELLRQSGLEIPDLNK